MFKHFLLVAARNLAKQRLYSAINILGLALGLGCCILILLFIRNEVSYDTHWEKADQIYRITREFKARNGSPRLQLSTMAPNAAPLLKEDFGEIESIARMLTREVLITREGVTFREGEVVFADAELTDIFDFDWVSGDPAKALSEPFTAVITEPLARKYFGRLDPLGSMLTLENRYLVKVTGVIRRLPKNTHLSFSALVSMPTLAEMDGQSVLERWGNNSFHTYALLPENYDIKTLTARFPAFISRHIHERANAVTVFGAQPLKSIHLHSRLENEMKANGNIATVYAFGAIALFVLLIACINFMNLATARSMQQATEVGIRKVLGATRPQVITQFLCESTVLAAIAVLLAVSLVELTLPRFNAFIGKELEFDYTGDPVVAGGLLVLTVTVGVVAGSYPAFFLSAFRPARVVGGEVARGRSGTMLREALVIGQFAISTALMIGTAVVFLQLRYARTMELGYDRNGVVVIPAPATSGFADAYGGFKDRLQKDSGVVSVTGSNLFPTRQNTNSSWIRGEGTDPTGRAMPYLLVDYDFFETYRVDVLAGRTFSERHGTDRAGLTSEANPRAAGAFVLNELAARQLGWSPDEAIGKWFEAAQAEAFAESIRGPVIGVVRDFHFSSIREKIKPVFYFIPPRVPGRASRLRFVSLRLSGDDVDRTLARIEEDWNGQVRGYPFTPLFVDSRFEALYLDERRQGIVFTAFAVLAIVVSTLGLLGLAAYSTERRTKEIGVRKVLGASVRDIVLLISRRFAGLVLISSVISWPVSYFMMTWWLQGFAYRIGLGPELFILSSAAALTVAGLTVGLLAARAAVATPVLALRYE